ncbi:MAG: cysteine--tRNA ligase [Gemmatimonadota bacterium]|jgi:cysteinyl-tRNA synthetase|nr:cysteine--tRNA ligase [Gemmatimonadota bacterium]MDP6803298.1 cysteine--tRNA ligase [Gemmatimonadota bacterium]MDP7032235.1 cysteine--tRNA ligase [Gemmatimonadota bacterium]
MGLSIFDTMRRRKIPFEPVVPGKVGMYFCGMTVQGVPHVGHMRAYTVADAMRRVLRARGYEVTLVQNFTDIDDKIIAKAAEEGVPWQELAERNIDAYFSAADWLGIERADVYPKATEHMGAILTLIGDLVEKGHAYAAGGDVYFSVETATDYGKLSGKRVEDLRAGVRVEVEEAKRHPVDFALWKGAKPGEPSWDSPWGAGRPGWHIECSAMAMAYLGETLDIHGGGRDLIFPHHENELTQSEASTGVSFCRHWTENGMVMLGGEKMSKSTGVFFAVEDVRKEVDPRVLRLFLLGTHYRSPLDYSRERLDEAATAMERITNFLATAAHAAAGSDAGQEPGEADAAFREETERCVRQFHEALDDDFNTAGALGKLFELARAGNAYAASGSPGGAGLLREAHTQVAGMLDLLGFPAAKDETGEIPPEVQALVDRRETARTERDWAAADSLRDEILACGFVVEDRPDGPLIKRA